MHPEARLLTPFVDAQARYSDSVRNCLYSGPRATVCFCSRPPAGEAVDPYSCHQRATVRSDRRGAKGERVDRRAVDANQLRYVSQKVRLLKLSPNRARRSPVTRLSNSGDIVKRNRRLFPCWALCCFDVIPKDGASRRREPSALSRPIAAPQQTDRFPTKL